MQSPCRLFCPRLRSITPSHVKSQQHRTFLSTFQTFYRAKPETPQEPPETHQPRRSAKIKGLDERTFRRKTVIRDGKAVKMLTPVVLSARITKLAEQDQLQEAIEMVQHAPPDAQNAVVWSNLISLVMLQQKYKEAYKLFTDMKRRGIRPSIRTFGALLQGYARIDDWPTHTAQLKNVHSIRDQLSRFMEAARETEEELNNIPFNLLIKIYGRALKYQKMYDVYNSLDKQGPLAPDIYTFTILLNAIANRRKADVEKNSETIHPLDTWPAETSFDHFEKEDDDAGLVDTDAIANKNASDARLIWRDLLRTCGVPDIHAIRAVLASLSKGRPGDQTLALNICEEYLGLDASGKEAQRTTTIIPMDTLTWNLLFSICKGSDRFKQAIQQQLELRRQRLFKTQPVFSRLIPSDVIQ